MAAYATLSTTAPAARGQNVGGAGDRDHHGFEDLLAPSVTPVLTGNRDGHGALVPTAMSTRTWPTAAPSTSAIQRRVPGSDRRSASQRRCSARDTSRREALNRTASGSFRQSRRRSTSSAQAGRRTSWDPGMPVVTGRGRPTAGPRLPPGRVRRAGRAPGAGRALEYRNPDA